MIILGNEEKAVESQKAAPKTTWNVPRGMMTKKRKTEGLKL